jgi:hypothetical protein
VIDAARRNSAPADPLAKLHTAVVIRPGDTLVLLAGHPLSDQEIDRIKEQIEEHLPGTRCAVVDGMVQGMVYRPEPEQTPGTWHRGFGIDESGEVILGPEVPAPTETPERYATGSQG